MTLVDDDVIQIALTCPGLTSVCVCVCLFVLCMHVCRRVRLQSFDVAKLCTSLDDDAYVHTQML